MTDTILLENNVPNLTKARQLLEGTIVTDALNKTDVEILQKAIFEKFKEKYLKIIDGFGKEKYDKITKDSLNFSFGYGLYKTFSLSIHFNTKRYSDSDSDFVQININFENGVDSFMAYGRTKTFQIRRSYKVQRLSYAIEKLEGIINKFVELTDKERPAYLEAEEDKKRINAQDKLTTLVYDLEEYHKSLRKYKIKPQLSDAFTNVVEPQIYAELAILKEKNLISKEQITRIHERMNAAIADRINDANLIDAHGKKVKQI